MSNRILVEYWNPDIDRVKSVEFNLKDVAFAGSLDRLLCTLKACGFRVLKVEFIY